MLPCCALTWRGVQRYENGAWKGYTAHDMQLEFVMLDPFIRTTMTPHASGNGTFVAAFKAPDRYGVFKFRVVYNRRGFTVLRSETLVSLRPLNHDEEERFIEAAFPYYASVASMMAGFVVFGCVFLYSRDE